MNWIKLIGLLFVTIIAAQDKNSQSQDGQTSNSPQTPAPSSHTVENENEPEDESSETSNCNQNLMESFDLDGQPKTTPDVNYLCPGINSNCCSYQTQLSIYKKYDIKDERGKIKHVYDNLSTALSQVYKAFTLVEHKSAEMLPYTTDMKFSNCARLAEKIQEVNIASFGNEIVGRFNQAAGFLKTARNGFYCSICDAKTHKFYDILKQKFQTSAKFCAQLTGAVMNYYLFRYKFFPRISRLLTQWAVSCDMRGNFDPTAKIKAGSKFYSNTPFAGVVERCARNYNKPGAILGCQKLCQRFNPIKLDRYFEGEVDKMQSLAKFIHLKVDYMMRKLNRKKKKNRSDSEEVIPRSLRGLNDRRILEEDEADDKTQKGFNKTVHLNEDLNEVSVFNRQFKTALIPPIEYDFKTDFKIKANRGFYDPLIDMGPEVIYNLPHYQNQVNITGIDFSMFGRKEKIALDNAMVVFSSLNPDANNSTFSLFLQKMK